MTAHLGGKAATISECRVILYKDPIMVLVACPSDTFLSLVVCEVLSSSVETS